MVKPDMTLGRVKTETSKSPQVEHRYYLIHLDVTTNIETRTYTTCDRTPEENILQVFLFLPHSLSLDMYYSPPHFETGLGEREGSPYYRQGEAVQCNFRDTI
jgi:hypothetical protein